MSSVEVSKPRQKVPVGELFASDHLRVVPPRRRQRRSAKIAISTSVRRRTEPMLPGMSGLRKTKKDTEPKKQKTYTLVPGTHVYTGPMGDRTCHSYEPPLTHDVVVGVLATRQTRGEGASFYVEVVKPPEMQGRRFWVAKHPRKGAGFY